MLRSSFVVEVIVSGMPFLDIVKFEAEKNAYLQLYNCGS